MEGDGDGSMKDDDDEEEEDADDAEQEVEDHAAREEEELIWGSSSSSSSNSSSSSSEAAGAAGAAHHLCQWHWGRVVGHMIRGYEVRYASTRKVDLVAAHRVMPLDARELLGLGLAGGGSGGNARGGAHGGGKRGGGGGRGGGHGDDDMGIGSEVEVDGRVAEVSVFELQR
jgi:hypothetical protein